MKHIFTLILTIAGSTAFAQWLSGVPSNSLYYSGNVGIGTNSPVSNLSLKGDYGLNVEPLINGPVNFYVTSNSADNIIAVNARTKSGAWDIPDQSKPSSYMDLSTNSISPYYGGISFFTRAAGASGYGTEKMTILNNGNIGIGTTSPLSNLSVKGDFGINIEPLTNGPTNFYVTSNSSDNIIAVNARTKYGAWEIPDSSKPSSYMDLSTNSSSPYYGGISFFTRVAGASGNGTEKMTLLNNGNVGIGTTSPDAKLAVAGQVHAQEVKVSVTVPGPDYVFEKEYALPSLDQLKSYISQNKHLPEVPSAKEMEQDGIKLSEMNMLLLKKVEELTLYVIELKKENEDLKGQFKTELESIKKQLNK
jgi:hypothetical protein